MWLELASIEDAGDGSSQLDSRAHQTCHHDTSSGNCSPDTCTPVRGVGGEEGRGASGPAGLRTPGVGDSVRANLVWNLSKKGPQEMWVHGEDGKQERGFHCFPPSLSCQTPESKDCLCGLPQQVAGAP